MVISNLRRLPGAGGTSALFDIELAPGVKLLNWTLKRAGDGIWTSYSPSLKGGTPASLAPLAVREQITAAAAAAYNGGRAAHAHLT